MNLAPVCLFVYNRLNETSLTVANLKANTLAVNTELFIFSDGPRSKDDIESVQSVRDFITTISGFQSVNVFNSEINKGLANSIISGVSEMLMKYSQVIILEDDLITSPNFLDFMNQALDFYNSYDRVISISGFTLPIDFKNEATCDIYFSYRASSWGWATWKDRWFDIDWEVADYTDFSLSRKLQVEFNRGGDDMSRMLKKQMNNDIDSWAIRFCYHQFKHDKLTVMPRVSKVRNIGLNDRATNTKFRSREYSTILDISAESQFYFSNSINVNDKINKQFRFYYSKYFKLKHRILNYFS
tara:strand:- start:66 stop:962 length:897 start_codon:yes stop_codon:yes gene_type:complete